MTSNAVYNLKARGRIETGWVRDCFCLFKSHQVNIRKLVLLSEQPGVFSELDVQFVLPDSAESLPGTFLGCLEEQLALQPWEDRNLSKVSG